MKSIHTIDDVIQELDHIITQCKNNNDPLGYFAALYRKVTIKVKEGIQNSFFDDGERMEQLDVIFAVKYIDAYQAYQKQEKITLSWQVAFDLSKRYWPIVLQHLLVGMNAHINLDLGVAAAKVSEESDIEDLKDDFDKINQILSSLVQEVENDLSTIWPMLKKLLKYTKGVDSFLIDFSMELARDGAWKFATELSETSGSTTEKYIEQRDQKVAQKATIITHPGWGVNLILRLIRLLERGTIANKIQNLKD